MWKKVSLSQVCDLRNGRAYKKPELLAEGKYPVLRVGNFFTSAKWYFSDLELDETKYCHNGDLLYAWSASFGARMWEGEKVIYHYHIWRVDVDAQLIDKKFLYYWFEFDKEQIKKESGTGTTMIHVSKSSMEKRELWLPPLAEQQRIVAKLDAAFAEIDRAADVVQQQLLQAQSMQQQKTDRVFEDIIGDKKTLNDVCNLITCGVAARPEYVEEGIPFLSAQNVKKGQVLYSNHKYITQEKYQELTKKNKPMQGDLLYTRVGSFGEAAVVESDIEFSIFVSLTLIKTKNELNPYYLKHYLNSQRLKTLASKSLSGSGVGNLNVGTVRKFPITLPSIEQQLEVVESLNDLADRTERLYATYQSKAAQLQSLQTAILAQELQPPQSEAA